MNKALAQPMLTPGELLHPLPPRLLGEMVGIEVLRATWLAHQMGIDFDVLADWDDEICPDWPAAPSIPLHVWPHPIEDADEAWTIQYHHGLSATLQRATGWQAGAPMVSEALEKSQRWMATAQG
jgi:hypothetical protein